MSATIARLAAAALLGTLILCGGNGIHGTVRAADQCHEGFCDDTPQVPLVTPGSNATAPVAGWARALISGSAA
ncbi:hypothetical protein [Nocardia sp. alder85J]|uniref:hypothetical protein n=1 Tax=Nocardia sp. alder85J TaxID=2862949 RepID=UPI001CD59B59|nr:hypothetical protein [Nocardia sp. alder85J]MCX4091186.1 hypothetical protein [Nocardia sp. alder85J]